MDLSANYLVHRIGGKIREYRKQKNLKLRELADYAGLSSAMLSKIENGRIIPTIPSLLSLISVLEVQAHEFFAEISQDSKFAGYILVRKENYVPYVKEENAVGFHFRSILEYGLNGNTFQISLVELESGSNRPLVSTAAFEFLYLLEGEIKYQLNDTVLELKAGDSIFFDGNIPHVPINHTPSKASYLVIYFFDVERKNTITPGTSEAAD